MRRLLALLFILTSLTAAQTVVIGAGTPTAISTVAFSATPTFNVANSSLVKITLTGNVTSSTFSGAVAGQTFTIQVCQDGTGGRTFVWPANAVNTPFIDPAASVCTTSSFIYDGTNVTAPVEALFLAEPSQLAANTQVIRIGPGRLSYDSRYTPTMQQAFSDAGVVFGALNQGTESGSVRVVNQSNIVTSNFQYGLSSRIAMTHTTGTISISDAAESDAWNNDNGNISFQIGQAGQVHNKANGQVGLGAAFFAYTPENTGASGFYGHYAGLYMQDQRVAQIGGAPTAFLRNAIETAGGNWVIQAGTIAQCTNTVTQSGATATFDLAACNNQKITLTAAVTTVTLSNIPPSGTQIIFTICENATGGFGFTYPATMKGGTAITTTLSTCNDQLFISNGTNLLSVAAGVGGLVP